MVGHIFALFPEGPMPAPSSAAVPGTVLVVFWFASLRVA